MLLWLLGFVVWFCFSLVFFQGKISVSISLRPVQEFEAGNFPGGAQNTRHYTNGQDCQNTQSSMLSLSLKLHMDQYNDL